MVNVEAQKSSRWEGVWAEVVEEELDSGIKLLTFRLEVVHNDRLYMDTFRGTSEDRVYEHHIWRRMIVDMQTHMDTHSVVKNYERI